MEKLKIGTHKKTTEIVDKYGFNFKKNFGQNFLIDSHVLNKIVDSSEITKEDLVIEVGPGIGSLTEYLSEKAKKVVCIEIDKKLIPILNETLAECDNVEIINEDILKVDLKKIIEEHGFKKAKMVANLPYYITTPIIMNVLENDINIETITVMIQKEVAKRMSAKPGTKDYGSLTIAVQYYSEPYLVANVPQNCFKPRPNVDSAVIRLKKKSEKEVTVCDEKLMFDIIKIAFSQRRKTLLNCIFNSTQFNFTKDEIENILTKCGVDIRIRGEKLTIKQFAILTDIIYNELN